MDSRLVRPKVCCRLNSRKCDEAGALWCLKSSPRAGFRPLFFPVGDTVVLPREMRALAQSCRRCTGPSEAKDLTPARW